MRWQLDTDNAVVAADLADELGRALDHYEATLDMRLTRNKLAAMEMRSKKLEPEPEQDAPTERNARHDAVKRQMLKGIEAAAVLAATMGDESTLFRATISGHVDPNYADGVAERIAVFVDVAVPPKTDD